MTVLETVLTFVGIPAAVVVLVVGLVYFPGSSSHKRYRPGREYDFAPVWYLARPEKVSVAGAADHVARAEADADLKILESSASQARAGNKGGASGNW
ncbi:MAG: aa3-type cytochrome oxidase subunit CtaJ [Stackebrandtia sp.]